MDFHPEFSVTNKGKPLLILNGFSYIVERQYKEKTVWRCEKYTVQHCRGRAHSVNGEITKLNDSHNHAPDHSNIGIRVFNEKLKATATETTQSTKEVLISSSQGMSLEVVSALPKISSIKRKVTSLRSKDVTVINPKDLSELSITEEYSRLQNGQQFLLFDSGNEETSRVLVFGTDENLKVLKKCKNWFCDGTFKSCPSLFGQLFIIVGKYEESAIPLLFCLMEDRKEESYKILFKYLMDAIGGYQPETVMSDFEAASRNAFLASFPATHQLGCFFHFMQCIWRHIRSESEIYKLYKEDSYFAFHLRYLPALAFVRENEVAKSYDELLKMPFFIKNKEKLSSFLTYFEKTWIGEKRRSRRLPPVFSISLWNHHNSIDNEWDKTNNFCEGFNRGFESLLSGHKPTIWRLLEALKKEQAYTELSIGKVDVGDPQPPRKRKKVVALHERLKNILENYDNLSLEEFMKAIKTYDDGEKYALIINILTNREGAEHDDTALYQTLTGCGFHVSRCLPNEDKKWTKKIVKKSIEDFRGLVKLQKTNGTKIAAVLIVVASHGIGPDTFVSSTGEYIFLGADVIDKFIAQTFHGIPKVILANFCRGKRIDTGFKGKRSEEDVSDDDGLDDDGEVQKANIEWSNQFEEWWSSKFEEESESDGETDYKPKHSDLLVAYSVYDGHKSVRMTKTGTWFLQQFCKTVGTKASNIRMDIYDILKMVRDEVMTKRTKSGKMNTPTIKDVGFQKRLEIQFRPT